MIRIGIFVGGRARRMGGLAKGLLLDTGGVPLITRAAAIAERVSPAVVLVGDDPRYAIPLPRLKDAGTDGPLGGLAVLLSHAHVDDEVVAIACDMPSFTFEMLQKLAFHAPGAAAVAPRRETRWEPLFARYSVGAVRATVESRLAAGALSLQGVLDAVATEPLPLSADEEALLSDWDRPEDLP